MAHSTRYLEGGIDFPPGGANGDVLTLENEEAVWSPGGGVQVFEATDIFVPSGTGFFFEQILGSVELAAGQGFLYSIALEISAASKSTNPGDVVRCTVFWPQSSETSADFVAQEATLNGGAPVPANKLRAHAMGLGTQFGDMNDAVANGLGTYSADPGSGPYTVSGSVEVNGTTTKDITVVRARFAIWPM